MFTRQKIGIFGFIFLISIYIFAGGGESEDVIIMDSAELETIINSGEDYILIDVRTIEEYSAGHIPSAINIPYDIIQDNLPSTDYSALIIVYCRSGRRSGIAKQSLEQIGYLNVIDFGSYKLWEKELLIEN